MMKDESCYCPVDDYHFKVVHVGMFNTQHGHVVCINAACVKFSPQTNHLHHSKTKPQLVPHDLNVISHHM